MIAIDWRPIAELEPVPNKRILVKYDDEADIYFDECDGKRGRLTIYDAHADGGSPLAGKGIAIVRWGGGFSEGSEILDEREYTMPDWWFEANSEFEVVVNPTHYAANLDLDQ